MIFVVDIKGKEAHQHIQVSVDEPNARAARNRAKAVVKEKYQWAPEGFVTKIVTYQGKPIKP